MDLGADQLIAATLRQIKPVPTGDDLQPAVVPAPDLDGGNTSLIEGSLQLLNNTFSVGITLELRHLL